MRKRIFDKWAQEMKRHYLGNRFPIVLLNLNFVLTCCLGISDILMKCGMWCYFNEKELDAHQFNSKILFRYIINYWVLVSHHECYIFLNLSLFFETILNHNWNYNNEQYMIIDLRNCLECLWMIFINKSLTSNGTNLVDFLYESDC